MRGGGDDVWGFDFAVSTNGYAASIQLSPEFNIIETFGERKCRQRKEVNDKREKKRKRTEDRHVPPSQRDWSLFEFPHIDDPAVVIDPDEHVFFVDPGKDPLLAVSDGVRHVQFGANKQVAAQRKRVQRNARRDHRHIIHAPGQQEDGMCIAEYEEQVRDCMCFVHGHAHEYVFLLCILTVCSCCAF